MVESPQFRVGDEVVHPLRREWGTGVVQQAGPAVYQGKQGQRLVVQFANQGRVTINTAVVPLVSRDAVNQMKSIMSQQSHGWLNSVTKQNGQTHELFALPESMTDPFASLGARLKATLESFKFSTDARSLIDWAVVQTGLNDPLTKYSRQELEQAFPRFTHLRDKHLADLAKQIKMKGRLELFQEALTSSKTEAAKAALQRAMRG